MYIGVIVNLARGKKMFKRSIVNANRIFSGNNYVVIKLDHGFLKVKMINVQTRPE